jgi:hypothetical protein
MTRLTVFNLPAIIRYSDQSLRTLLFDLVFLECDVKIKKDPFPEVLNFEVLIHRIYRDFLEIDLSTETLEKYRKDFKKALKKLYLTDEDLFEVRPGVQNLFNHFSKEKKWKYGIISNLWEDSTRFILQSCGVFSKDKLTIHAEDGLSPIEQAQLLLKRSSKKTPESEITMQVVSLSPLESYLPGAYMQVGPKASSKEDNYYVYPRFHELFNLKKKEGK